MVRYIGQTTNPHGRYRDHILMRGVQKKRDEWVISLAKKNTKPLMVLLDSVRAVEADSREQYWINHFKCLGCPLMQKKLNKKK